MNRRNVVDVIIDSDASNSADDQVAIAYALLSKGKINVRAIHSVPYVNGYSASAAIGADNSYNKITELLEVMNCVGQIPVHKGSTSFLSDKNTPVKSDATENLIRLSKEYDENNRLTVLMMGAATNVASALLLAPDLKNRIQIVRVGGHVYSHPYNREFNMSQDLTAEQVVFETDLPMVQIPCEGVANTLLITKQEVQELLLKSSSETARYLAKIITNHVESRELFGPSWSFPIWDLAAVAWLFDEEKSFMESTRLKRPRIDRDGKYVPGDGALDVTYVYKIKRDKVINHLLYQLIGGDGYEHK